MVKNKYIVMKFKRDNFDATKNEMESWKFEDRNEAIQKFQTLVSFVRNNADKIFRDDEREFVFLRDNKIMGVAILDVSVDFIFGESVFFSIKAK